MPELLRFVLASSDDVAVARTLTRDVAREAGLSGLGQTKLATVVSELARRCLLSAGGGEVVFSVDAAHQGGDRLVVTVSGSGPAPSAARTSRAGVGTVRTGLDLRSLGRLVDTLEHSEAPGGGSRAVATMRLDLDVTKDPALARRLDAVLLRDVPSTPEPHGDGIEETLRMLETRSAELALTQAELRRANEERNAVIDELALTNRGVLDLLAELSTVNDSLTISGANYRQLADQQSALADLGHRAVASRDVNLLALGLVGIVRRVLGITAVGVLRFSPGRTTLDVVAADGCEADLPPMLRVGQQRIKVLLRSGTAVVDLTSARARAAFPLPTVREAHSGAVVAVHTPAGPWGVLVASDMEAGRFTSTTVAFLEAVASLLAFSIARMVAEGAAEHAAQHDALTGLPNRAQLLVHLAGLVADAPVGHTRGQRAVIFIDIDGFKQVNDTVGHAAGDQVLIETSSRLRRRLRSSDILARLGGDEFVVLCEGDSESADVIAARLLGAFDDPFVLATRELFLSGSAGIALVGGDVTPEQILADADIAMYRAKLTSGSATVLFSPEMRALAESESRLHNELRRALERGQLRAVYQPIVDLGDGTVRSVEALLRWSHPDLGSVPAQQTVAAAERIGLAWELTCWIAAEGAATISRWNAANPGHPPLRLGVNFTPLLLGDPSRVGEFEAHVTGAGLPFVLLDVELTETAFADPTPDLLASMAELRARGARLAMDDFGTGYSSLISLATLPLDVLKIDRSFVTPLGTGRDRLLVAAMTGIALGRSLETIGEGIETTDQLTALIAVECDLGQGYLFSKALEKEQMQGLALLERRFADTVRQARLGPAGGPIPQHPRAAMSASGGAGRARPARVLVVDANPDDLELLRRILDGTDYDVIGVTDPGAFVAVLQETPPDLVLMDLRFGRVSGFELVEQSEALLTMPVVAVTGYPEWVVRDEPRSRLFTDVIYKPVDASELLARLRDLLGGSPRGARRSSDRGSLESHSR